MWVRKWKILSRRNNLLLRQKVIGINLQIQLNGPKIRNVISFVIALIMCILYIMIHIIRLIFIIMYYRMHSYMNDCSVERRAFGEPTINADGERYLKRFHAPKIILARYDWNKWYEYTFMGRPPVPPPFVFRQDIRDNKSFQNSPPLWISSIS